MFKAKKWCEVKNVFYWKWHSSEKLNLQPRYCILTLVSIVSQAWTMYMFPIMQREDLYFPCVVDIHFFYLSTRYEYFFDLWWFSISREKLRQWIIQNTSVMRKLNNTATSWHHAVTQRDLARQPGDGSWTEMFGAAAAGCKLQVYVMHWVKLWPCYTLTHTHTYLQPLAFLYNTHTL